MAYILIDHAGLTRAPAAVLHPDDPLPKTWRVINEWSYRGQRGAWLERTSVGGSWQYGRPETPMLAQVVYRTTAKHSPRTSTIGHQLKYASRALVCNALDLSWATCPKEVDYREASGSEAQSDADKAARADHLGIGVNDLRARDEAALDRYVAEVRAEALKNDPLGKHHPDKRLIEGWADWVVRRSLHSDIDSAMVLYDTAMSPDARAWGATIRPMVEARARAKLSAIASVSAPAAPPKPAADAPGSALPSLEAPPEPGVSRAKWIGKHITGLVAFTDPKRPAHTRRRVAARLALARIDGYCATDPDNDALYIADASLELAGLNEYARRVLDFGETPITGGTQDALL